MVSLLATGVLILLMFGMGMGLAVEDFRRVVKIPKAALLGLFGQLLLLPLVGFMLCFTLKLSGEVALGVMLLTLCPGGVLSNLFTLLARGDVALSVTMTSIASLVTVFTLPIAINLSMLYFSDSSVQISLPLLKTALQIMVITIIPVSLGMVIFRRAPAFAERARHWVRTGCMMFLPLVIIGVFFQNDGIWFKNFLQLGAITVALNLLSILLGFSLGKLARLEAKQVRTLSIEVGAQNAILGVTIAISPFLLNNAKIAMVPSIYGVTMVATLGAYIVLSNYFQDKKTSAK